MTGIETSLASVPEEADPSLTCEETGIDSVGRDHWKHTVAVRSIDVVFFEFCHISLPHQPPALGQCLQALLPQLTVHEAAEYVHDLFVTEGIYLSPTSLAKFRSWWTNAAGPMPNNGEQEQEPALKTLVRMDTFVRNEDWRVARALLCISCTREAADQLSELSRRPRPSPVATANGERWTHVARNCTCISDAIAYAKWPPRIFAACTAIDAASFSLAQDRGGGGSSHHHLAWTPSRRSIHFEAVRQAPDLASAGRGGGRNHAVRGERRSLQRGEPGAICPVAGWRSSSSARTGHMGGKRAVILLKSDWFPSRAAQKFCFLLVQPPLPEERPDGDGDGDGDGNGFAALVEGAVWGPVAGWTIPSAAGETREEELREFCEYWVLKLRGEL